MKRILCILILLSTLLAEAAPSISERDVKEALDRLDIELKKRNTYKTQRRAKIDSVKAEIDANMDSAEQCIELTFQLAKLFEAYDNDSTLFYLQKGYSLSVEQRNDTMSMYFRLKYLTFLPLSGKATEAVDFFNATDTTHMSRDLFTAYYRAGTQLSSYVISAVKNQPDYVDNMRTLRKVYQKKLISLLPENDYERKFNEGEYAYSVDDYSVAEDIFLGLMDTLPDNSNLYARASHNLSQIASIRGDLNAEQYYLAISAISDIKAATLEVTSLQMLGMLLYDMKDLNRSYFYLTIALENAVECNASMRVLETSSTLPLIEKAHSTQVRKSMQQLTVALIIAVFLLIIVATLLFYLRQQISQKSTLQSYLEEANKTKEIYLSQFINLCSNFVSKLTSFNQMVHRKASANKTDDLVKITSSGKFVEEQLREFYDTFDEAFLHIYPTFVESVNELLLPDKKIVPTQGERLNTDLRILAFIRLGIEDTSRVAQMLNYSVNTIYAYRNRLRNRAINRDSFEDDIMKISSI